MDSSTDEMVFENYFDYEKIMERGKEEFKLEGKPLMQYMQQEEAKALERYGRRIKIIEARMEAEKREAEHRHRLEEQEFQHRAAKEKAEQDSVIQLQLLAAQGQGASIATAQSKPINKPKLVPFDDGKDDVDAYIKRFELYAVACKWPREEWGVNLGALLQGTAMDVYTRLTADEVTSYDRVTEALRRHFQLNQEGYRKKFFSMRPSTSTTASTYLSTLTECFDRWIAMAEVPKSFDGLRNLMVKEQFLHVLRPEMSSYIRDKEVLDLEAVRKTAEKYADINGLYKKSQSGIGQIKSGPGKFFPSYRGQQSTNQAKTTDKPTEAAETSGSLTSDSKLKKPLNMKDKKCFKCGELGHISLFCPQKSKGKDTISATCTSPQHRDRGELKIVQGLLNGEEVSVLRDTGSQVCLVRESTGKAAVPTGRVVNCECAFGDSHPSPEVSLYVDTPYYKGEIKAVFSKKPPADLVIGNIPGAKQTEEGKEAVMAVTRQTARKTKGLKPLRVVACEDIDVTPAEMKDEQQKDETLRRYRELAEMEEEKTSKNGNLQRFVYDKDLLYKRLKMRAGEDYKQLVVPEKYRDIVMKIAHDSLFAGHLAIKKTMQRIELQFYWPNLHSDVTRYVKSCDVCQRTIPKGRVTKVPLNKMPVVDVPFSKVACDLVGPIFPPTERKHRYIVTVVDYATRYPDCIALKNIETETVAEALVEIFSRVGIPRQILTDNGAQFTSGMMEEVCRLLSVQQLFTTPYHAQCNGLVERFQGTLKQMLKRLCESCPKDWDRYLLPLLFAYREAPQESLGFSPFELLYGRSVRGPMSILRDMWTSEGGDEDTKTTYQYVFDLRNRIEDSAEIASQCMKVAQANQHKHFNRRAKPRSLEVGNKVLLLLPTSNNKLLTTWRGPYTVVGKKDGSPDDYLIELEAGKRRLFHINMLKRYLERDSSAGCVDVTAAVSVLPDPALYGDKMELIDHNDLCEKLLPDEPADFHDCNVYEGLTDSQKAELWSVLEEYSDCLSNVPGTTNLMEHVIELTSDDPVRVRPYPLPYHRGDVVRREVESMLDMGMIEPSTSPYSAPIVLVEKSDKTVRFCCDYRKLNKITVFDAEPVPDIKEIYLKLQADQFLSKCDFTKGYNQIPVRECDKPKTAFATPFGLFQWSKMPFGLVNSGATYGKMMRKLLRGTNHVDNFVDDVVCHTQDWKTHIETLHRFLGQVRKAGLTLKPKKCFFGCPSVEFVGHVVGKGELRTMEDKTDKIRNAARPQTKKELNSFLGLTGYYREYVYHYADIAYPLTELLKSSQPEKLKWGSEEDKAYIQLKEILCSQPVLRLPDLAKMFVLRTDASSVGLGAVLMQEWNSELFPVMYASRKLKGPELNYSVTEKECMGVVWGIHKFYMYLYGREFLLQTDHQSLSYLQEAKLTNPKLMRWALSLQIYRFRVQSIAGLTNVGADYLSRCGGDV